MAGDAEVLEGFENRWVDRCETRDTLGAVGTAAIAAVYQQFSTVSAEGAVLQGRGKSDDGKGGPH